MSIPFGSKWLVLCAVDYPQHFWKLFKILGLLADHSEKVISPCLNAKSYQVKKLQEYSTIFTLN